MSQPFDASRSLTALEQDSTIIAVIEMSQSKLARCRRCSRLERQPLKKLDADEEALLKLLHRWRDEAGQAGRQIKRIVVAFEAGRDGFWLARWLRARDVEAYVIHPASVAVSREHRRAKTDRLDTELLMRAFLGWLRGETRPLQHGGDPDARGGGRQAAEPRAREPGRRAHAHRQPDEGDAGPLRHSQLQADAAQGRGTLEASAHRRGDAVAAEHAGGAAPRYGAAALRAATDQGDRAERLAQALGGSCRRKARMRWFAASRASSASASRRRTCWCSEVLSRHLRDRKAVARYAGLTGSPDESGSRRREKGLAKRGQRPRAARHDPVGLALSPVPEGQRAGPMVSGANGRWPRRHAQDDDRGAGAKAADRALASRARRARCRMASSCVRRHERRTRKQRTTDNSLAARCVGLPMTIRGGGDPTQAHGFQAAVKNGPAAPELRRRCA